MKLHDPFNLLDEQSRQEAEQLMERYGNYLSCQQLSEGIAACLENADALWVDAQLLADSARWGRAMTLLIAAMEEFGKISVLCSMARIPMSNQRLWAGCWKNFRSHDEKSTWAFTHTYSDASRFNPAEFAQAAMAQRGLSGLCERLRQYGLYVDFHAKQKKWLSPADVQESDVTSWTSRVEAAVDRCHKLNKLGLYSENALELQRTVYEDFNKDRPRRKDLTPDNVADSIDQGPELAQLYFRRLVSEGILQPDADLTLLGLPIT